MDKIGVIHNNLVQGQGSSLKAANIRVNPVDEWTTGPRDASLVKSPYGAGQGAAAHGSPKVAAPAPAEELPAAAPSRTGTRILGAVALGIAGLGVVAGLAPQLAFAQQAPVATTQTQTTNVTDNRVRDQRPVQVSTVQQVVDQFQRERQLYVVGNPQMNGRPFSQAEMQRFQDVLRNHPNAYVVLVERSDNVTQDDMTLSRGIGNSQEFQSVVNPQLGERDGMVFMFYFTHYHNGRMVTKQDGSPDRKIFMRGEALLDRLNVSEAQFGVGPNGPYGLMADYVNAFRNEGKDVPGALEVVMNKVNARVNQEVQETVGNAQQQVQSARTALTGVQPKIAEFKRNHPRVGGQIGNPNVDGWRARLASAETALRKRDFATATRLSQGLLSEIRTQEQAMANYGQAGAIAQEVNNVLGQVQDQLPGLPNNSAAARANEHYTSARQSMERYETAYESGDPAFWDHLQSARTDANKAASEASESKSDAARATAIKRTIAGAVTLAFLVTLIVLNRRAAARGRKAEIELDEALKEIGDKSKELMELLNVSDIHEVASYEGKTKALADALRTNTVEALTLVGGAEKFREEAEALVHAGGLGRLKNWFLTGNFDKAIDLLTNPDTKLTFSFSDSSRAVMEKGSKAEKWRDGLLKAGETREFQASLQEVLEAMADRRDQAKAILAEIETKSAEINGYIERVQDSARSTGQKAAALQQSAQADALFAAPAVSDNLLPMVEGEGGHLPKARNLANHNFIAAWDDHAAPAERMANEAAAIVELGESARKELVPTIAQADAALHPHQVKTDWAHDKQKALSNRLNDAANKALRTSVAADITRLDGDIDELRNRVNTTVAHDKERREVSPGLISKAETDVANSRTEIAAELQRMGVFKGGKPDQVLRELERDPSMLTQDAHNNLNAIKGRLDVGDVETSAEHLQNIRDLTADAHGLVKDTKDALKSYTATLAERKQRTTSTEASIAGTYAPTLKRIQSTYAGECMQLVSAEAHGNDKDQTIADNITQAQQGIATARQQIASAEKNFDKAYILTSKDDLTATDATLKATQAKLDAVANAETILGNRQQKAQTDLQALDGRMAQTRANVNQHFVRDPARRLMQDANSKTETARNHVQGSPKNPYRADEALRVAENTRVQTESAVEADRRAYNEARQAIANAQREAAAGTAAIASASGWSKSRSNGYGVASASVSQSELMPAHAQVAAAMAEIAQAEALLSSQQYEQAEAMARQADGTAARAAALAAAAISSAESEFNREWRHIEGLREDAERRERERQEAEERARRAREDSSSSSSGSSGGSWGGGGGSGSNGGSW